mmetsp:Transcript_15616/g.59331  ORF Transcript_15616/g.59331 Transcript_15616/m.59331 type:complete len:206 (-) Transcript_15616:3106-3723(-)
MLGEALGRRSLYCVVSLERGICTRILSFLVSSLVAVSHSLLRSVAESHLTLVADDRRGTHQVFSAGGCRLLLGERYLRRDLVQHRRDHLHLAVLVCGKLFDLLVREGTGNIGSGRDLLSSCALQVGQSQRLCKLHGGQDLVSGQVFRVPIVVNTVVVLLIGLGGDESPEDPMPFEDFRNSRADEVCILASLLLGHFPARAPPSQR